jgi:hypothetical protein
MVVKYHLGSTPLAANSEDAFRRLINMPGPADPHHIIAAYRAAVVELVLDGTISMDDGIAIEIMVQRIISETTSPDVVSRRSETNPPIGQPEGTPSHGQA